MKQKNYQRWSRWLLACLLSLLMTLGGASPAWAETLTVYDQGGNINNQYVPIYGYYCDGYTKSEMIMPSSKLGAMAGATISRMDFYLNGNSGTGQLGNNTSVFKVFLKEVNTTSISAYTGYGENDVVYSGTLSIVDSKISISFTENYVYQGGNLLIGIYKTTSGGSCPYTYFYGETVNEASIGGGASSYYGLSGVSANQQNFLPKTTFTYTPDPNYIAKPSNVRASNITATTATISWNAVDGADSYELSCSTNSAVPDAEGSYTSVNTSSYNLTGLLAENVHYVYVRTIKGDKHSAWSTVCSFEPTAAVTAIVNDGSATNGYVPIYGLYADIKNTQSQFIIPATSLEDISGGTIKKLSFHTNGAYDFGNAATKVYLKEVNYTSLSSYTPDFSGMTEVYDGAISVVDNQMLISFDTPFAYNDENLMIAFQQTENGGGSSISWLGISSSNNPATGGYSDNFGYRQFLPKMTITYLPSNNPKMSVVSESSYDFGFLTSASENAEKTASFTIKNIGAAALTDANVSYSGDAAIAVSPNGTLSSIDAKSSTDITITVATENTGTYAGTITVTGTGSDNVVIPVKAIVRNTDKLFIDFDENNPKPAAWTLGSGWSVNSTNSIATIGNATAAITTSEILSAGETLTLRYRGNYDGDGASLAVSYSTTTVDGDYTDAVETVSSIGYNVWKYATFTIPATAKFVKVTGKYIDLDAFYGLQAPAVPVVVLSTTSHDFGLVSNADTQALTLTISNEGGAALNGLTVTPTSGFAVTDMEGNALTTTTIAASSSLSVKVKVDAVGQQNGTVTISGTGIDNQIVNVSGYMLDDTKILETFATQPKKWSFASGWTFNSTTGAYSGTSSRTVITPTLTVGASEVLALNVKLGWNGGSLIVEGSEDNGDTWTAFDAKTYNSSNGGLNTSSYTLITIDDIPTTVNKLRLTGYYAYINVFNGFTYTADPQLGLYTDEDCTVAAAAEVNKNFGFVTSAQQQKYYIKNDWTGQIDLTVNIPTGFTTTLDDNALTKDEKATLTITMPNTPEGLHNSSVVVTAKNHADDAVLGTFTVNLNGAVAGSKNDVNFASLSDVPAGWDKGSWTVTANSFVQNNSGTAQELTTATFTVGAGETLLVEAQGTSSYNETTLTYSYKAGEADWTEAASIGTVTYDNWKVYAITGIPTGDAKVKFSGTYVRIRRIYGFTAKVEPFMVFAADGTTKNFGMITAKATSDAYTITNSGTALLENLSVTCNNDNFEIAVADNATSIAAGGSVTFTVALKTTALGSQSGTVTIAGTGVESKTFTVKGYVADGTKIFTTFASLPDRWENSGWTFNASTGAYSSSSSNTLTSPKIIVTGGQKLAISAKINSNSTYYYVTVKGSSDNGATFEAYTKQLTYDALNKDDYTVVELDDIPTTVNKIQLIGYYVYVNGLNGFTYDNNDPEFSMFSDSECNTPIAGTTATNNWGFVTEDKTATYYIKNTGTGTLNLSKTDAPAGMTATLGATSLTANEITSLVISMENDTENNEGYHAGDVVLTGKNSASETLGTFTVTSSGVVVGSKTDVNFTTLDAFPAGWEATGWSVTANTKATTSSTNKTLTTGTYTIAAGEKLVIEGKGNYSWNSPSLTYEYSTDGGSSWTAGESTLSYTYSASDYQLQVIDDIPAGTAKIKFTGSYMDIRRIYGYTAVLEPAMTLSPAAVSYDFGMQTADAEYVITVTNSGTADMTNLAAALTGDDKDDFEVAVSKNTVPYTGENTATVTVTLKASTEYKEHNATLTISADGLADKVITLKGKTRDASKNYVDFASEIPSSFVEKGAWTVSSGAAYSGSGESSLITQPINLATGEKIYFDAKKPSYGSPSLQVRYSVNGGISWSDYVDYTAAISSTAAYSSHEIDLENASAVTAIVEFKGNYHVYLDNIYGGVLNDEAPMIRITKSAAVVENGTTEAFGSISTQATATYTVTNVGNGTLTITSPVATTGVATATVSATSLSNGQSATLTITMPVAAPYEYKEGAVTIVTNLGNFVINYNATVLNPNALDEQFASGKPAGWYFGGYWEVDNQTAQNSASGVADLITEQLTVAGPSDELTFKAAKTGSSAETFRVYTSQDRVTWDAVDLGELTLTTSYQDVNISGLAAGDYYVKIIGARVKVDNFLGWTKKNNTRDLYVTATTFPATTTKGNEATITATVTSLIADVTGVYAKLFINGVQEGDASAAQNIDLNGTKTFSFNYAIPENKTAQIKVYYSDNAEAFATAENAMKVNYTLEQTSSEAITTGTFNVTLVRPFVEGWNTVCLPFNISDVVAFFGEGAKAYDFTSYSEGTLGFTSVNSLDASYPYVVYLPTAITEDIVLQDITIANTSTTADSRHIGDAYFRGTYVPIAAGGWTKNAVNDKLYGVTSAGKIAKIGNTATSKGFRGYFDLPAGATARLSFFDETTGITTVMDAKELNNDGKVYNLNGQRVENAHKGLYIMNGRKVVVK